MKKNRNLFKTLSLILFVLCLVSCENDDDPIVANFVACVGFTNTEASIRYSENGTYWASSSITPISQTSRINGLEYGNNIFIGIGNGIYSYMSNDGISWQQTYLDSIVTYNDVAFGEYHNQSPWLPYFVAVGNNGAVMFTSDSGSTWTGGSSGVIPNLNAIAFGLTTSGLSMFVAVGDAPTLSMVGMPEYGTILYSLTAGESWIEHSSGGTYSDLECIAFGNGRFIAGGTTGAIIYSTNGAAWQNATSNTTKDIYGICYGITNGSPIWVAVGEEGTILYSQDNGNNWVAGSYDTEKHWQAVTYRDNKFFAVGYGGDGGYTNGVEGKVIYSNDGINWSSAATFAGHENYFWDIACKN